MIQLGSWAPASTRMFYGIIGDACAAAAGLQMMTVMMVLTMVLMVMMVMMMLGIMTLTILLQRKGALLL